MRRRRSHASVTLIGALALSLVGSMSFALERAAMGPEQCCKTHCARHAGHGDHTGRAAQRCCRMHLTVIPAATGKAPDVGTSTFLAVLATPSPIVVTRTTVLDPTVLDGRAPPATSLVAHHVSLLI